MLYRIAALPFLALLFGAIDTLLVRRAFEHRALGSDLFFHSVLLWLVLGLLALIPGLIWSAWRSKRLDEAERSSTTRAVASQAIWTLAPVALHQSLDQHTNIGGDLSGLLSGGALLGVGLTILVLVFGGKGVRALLDNVGSEKVAILTALLGLGLGLFVHFHEDPSASAPAESEAAAGRPNVLLMIWDTSRAKSVNLYGYKRETTPHLDALAESSVRYQFARSVSSYTLTSHLSMMTGVYPSHHGARLTRQIYDPNETPSVAVDFASEGYRTGGFVGTGVLSAGTGFGWGFEVFDDLVDPAVCDTKGWALVHDVQAVLAKLSPFFDNNGRPHWFQDFQRPAGEVLDRAAAWIGNPDPRPWFCLVNMYDVHWPYLPNEEAESKWVEPYAGPANGFLFRANGWDDDYEMLEEDRHHMRHLYDAEMWELDQRVAAFLADIDLDRTAVVITSDHGEAFGEGGRWEHNDILECQLRVPLLVRPAGGTEGREELTATSGVDMAPTLLDLAGILDARLEEVAPEDGPRFFGRSLLREVGERDILVEDRDHPDKSDVRLALYHQNYKLVRLGIGDLEEWQLHDLAEDPNALRDIADRDPELTEELKQRLRDLRAGWGADDEADFKEGGGHFNPEVLEGLGYTE